MHRCRCFLFFPLLTFLIFHRSAPTEEERAKWDGSRASVTHLAFRALAKEVTFAWWLATLWARRASASIYKAAGALRYCRWAIRWAQGLCLPLLAFRQFLPLQLNDQEACFCFLCAPVQKHGRSNMTLPSTSPCRPCFLCQLSTLGFSDVCCRSERRQHYYTFSQPRPSRSVTTLFALLVPGSAHYCRSCRRFLTPVALASHLQYYSISNAGPSSGCR